MKFFLDFCNLLHSDWELFSTHPVLFVLFAVLVFALSRFFYKNKLDLDLLKERRLLEDELCHEREENSKLELKNRRLMEESQKLRNDNEKLGQRVRELNMERIRSLRKIEQLEEKIKNLGTQKKLAEAQIVKRAEQRSVSRVEQGEKQEVQTLDFEKMMEHFLKN